MVPMSSVSPSDVEAVARATARLFLDAEGRWLVKEQARLAALAEAARVADEQAEDLKQVHGCYDTATLFGFDLLAIVASIEATPAIRPAQLVEMSVPAQKMPTVKEFILKAAQEAWPNRVRASELRRQMFDKFGWELHDKTAGMTLYRLLKEGRMKRSGSDWFWNPEGPANDGAVFDQPPDFKESGEPPDIDWLHEVAG